MVESLDVPDAVKNEFHLLIEKLDRAEREVEAQRKLVAIRDGELNIERRRVALLEGEMKWIADKARATITKSLSYMGDLGRQRWPENAALASNSSRDHADWSGRGGE